MKKITIKNPDYTIEINGDIYTVNIDEYESIAKASELSNKYSDLSKISTAAEVDGAKKEICEYINEVLGAGAVEKIMGGKPPKLAFLAKLAQELVRFFGEVNAQYMAQEYGE